MSENAKPITDEENKTYCVTVVRTGCIFVTAKSETEALEIANHQLTDSVSWSDEWEATDATEDPDADPNDCFTENAFE